MEVGLRYPTQAPFPRSVAGTAQPPPRSWRRHQPNVAPARRILRAGSTASSPALVPAAEDEGASQ